MKTHKAYQVQWIESEAGWGQKADGVSLHDTRERAQLYSKTNSGGSPDCYWRTDGIIEVEVSDAIFKKITKGDGTYAVGQKAYSEKFRKVLVETT